MTRRSIAGLIYVVEILHGMGEDVRGALHRVGLHQDRLDPTALIDRDLELRANAEIAARVRNPLAGLRAGARLGIASYGPFTALLLTCDDALHAARTAIRFQQLTFLLGRLTFEPSRTRSGLVLTPPPLPLHAQRFRIDLEVAGTLRLMNDLRRTCRVAVTPQLVVMPYARPAEAHEYVATFGCPVEWNGTDAVLLFPNRALHARFATADPTAHRVLTAQCARLLVDAGTVDQSVTSRVRAYIATCAGAQPNAAGAADALGTSERSLRRRLGAEGVSYRALLEEYRAARAKELLRDQRLPIAGIAQRLGYSECAAFIHAFKRWTGTTPVSYRRSAAPQ